MQSKGSNEKHEKLRKEKRKGDGQFPLRGTLAARAQQGTNKNSTGVVRPNDPGAAMSGQTGTDRVTGF